VPTIEVDNPLSRLTDEQIETLGEEFAAIHDEIFADLGERWPRSSRTWRSATT
jgi:hypothetical protein